MSRKLLERWEGRSGGLFRNPNPLRSQINYAINRVELQIQRTNNHVKRYETRDREIFEQIVKAYERHDNRHANVLAGELAEIRRQKILLMNAKLAMDDVALRLRTIFDFGDFVSGVTPLTSNLQGIKTRISGILPDVGNELDQVGVKLNELATGAGRRTGTAFNFDVSSDEARKILEEAGVIAENRTKKFPDIPSDESGQ